MTEEETPSVEFARVFIKDGSYIDAVLTAPWEVFVHGLVTNGCVITSFAFVERASIVKVLRLYAAQAPTDSSNVISFPEPKGSA